MDSSLSLHALTESRGTVTLLATALLCNTFHHYLSIRFFRARLARTDRSHAQVEVAAVLSQRLTGTLLLGVIPTVVAICALGLTPEQIGWTLGQHWQLSLLGGLGIASSVLFSGPTALRRSAGLREYYPEMRIARWNARLDALNLASWAIYLTAYELFFRGILLFPLAQAWGAWPAVLITSALYTYAHLPKHPIECASVVPGGFLFAALALTTQSIIGPVFGHTLVAAGVEWMAARKHAPKQELSLRTDMLSAE